MKRFSNTFAFLSRMCGKPVARKWLLGSVAALSLAGGLTPSLAQAHDRDYDRDHVRGRHVEIDVHIGQDRCEPRYEERQVRVWVPPVYRTVSDRNWCEPVYRTVCDRRFIEPVYQTVCEKVWVPDVCETREVRRYDPRCRAYVVSHEQVIVCVGHYETRERRVCVSEGRWETIERRECVSEGRFDVIERQECVAEGHYEYRTERSRVAERTSPFDVINPMLAGLGAINHR